MKFDKETLIKQRFWVLLGTVVPLVIAGLVVLWMGAGDEIEAKAKALDESKQKLSGIITSPPENKKFTSALEVRKREVLQKELEIWGRAWKGQEPDFTSWPVPPASEGTFTVNLKDQYFGDFIPDNDRDLYRRPEVYRPYVAEVYELAEPYNKFGEVMVQFKGGWEKVLRYVDTWKDPVPWNEEVWLAQEDLWVQREMMRIVRAANESVATLRKVADGKPDRSKGEIDRHTYRNSDWELDLGVVRGAGTAKPTFVGRITNVSPRRQSLGVHFTVRMAGVLGGEGSEEDLFVEGEPLRPNESADLNPQQKPFPSAAPAGPVQMVLQVYDWRTAPVKRIDQLVLGFVSDDRAGEKDALKPARVFQAGDKGGGGGGSGGGGETMKGKQAPKGMDMTPGASGGALGGGTGGSDERTPNGLQRKRYLDSIAQVRRMPVALLLVVEEEHVQEVLAAVANSAMRIQTTQVQWQHYRGTTPLKPAGNERSAPPARKKKPTRPGTGVGTGPGTGPNPVGFTPGQPGATAAPKGASNEEPTNVVELAVYGIASLYERYPPREATKPGAGGGTKGASGGK